MKEIEISINCDELQQKHFSRMGLLARQFICIHLVPCLKTKLNYSIVPKSLRRVERGSSQQLLPACFEVGQSRPCPQDASSLRETDKYRKRDAATTEGCGALSLGWGREAGSCALGTESRGAGTVLHKSTRHSVRS